MHVAGGVLLGALALPLLPLRTVDHTFGTLLGWAVEPQMLTHDMHGQHGWHEHAATVERVVEDLPPDERDRAALVVGSYSQAAALQLLRSDPTPRALSGHMSYNLWGPPLPDGDVLVTYGLPTDLFEARYDRCEEVDRVAAPLARPFDTDLPVHVCRGPDEPLPEWWPELRAYRHHRPRANVQTD